MNQTNNCCEKCYNPTPGGSGICIFDACPCHQPATAKECDHVWIRGDTKDINDPDLDWCQKCEIPRIAAQPEKTKECPAPYGHGSTIYDNGDCVVCGKPYCKPQPEKTEEIKEL